VGEQVRELGILVGQLLLDDREEAVFVGGERRVASSPQGRDVPTGVTGQRGGRRIARVALESTRRLSVDLQHASRPRERVSGRTPMFGRSDMRADDSAPPAPPGPPDGPPLESAVAHSDLLALTDRGLDRGLDLLGGQGVPDGFLAGVAGEDHTADAAVAGHERPTGVALLDGSGEDDDLTPRLVRPVDVAAHRVEPTLHRRRPRHQLRLPAHAGSPRTSWTSSPDRVYAAWRRGLRHGARAALLDELFPVRAPVVTVHDASSHALAWLASALGVPAVPLGVDAFGESGSVRELYGLDPESIVGAAETVLEVMG